MRIAISRWVQIIRGELEGNHRAGAVDDSAASQLGLGDAGAGKARPVDEGGALFVMIAPYRAGSKQSLRECGSAGKPRGGGLTGHVQLEIVVLRFLEREMPGQERQFPSTPYVMACSSGRTWGVRTEASGRKWGVRTDAQAVSARVLLD